MWEVKNQKKYKEKQHYKSIGIVILEVRNKQEWYYAMQDRTQQGKTWHGMATSYNVLWQIIGAEGSTAIYQKMEIEMNVN